MLQSSIGLYRSFFLFFQDLHCLDITVVTFISLSLSRAMSLHASGAAGIELHQCLGSIYPFSLLSLSLSFSSAHSASLPRAMSRTDVPKHLHDV